MAPEPKTNRRETTATQRAKIWDRYEQGYRISAIVNHFKLPRSTIQGIIGRRLKSGDDSFQNKPGRGRHKKTDDRGDRRLVRHALTFPKDTLYALASPSKSGQKLCRSTVRKILKTAGKAKRKARKKPYLKPEHKLKRRIWCTQQKRTNRRWDRVCWSDEVTFEVGKDGTVTYVTRGPGEEY
jgi:transposase